MLTISKDTLGWIILKAREFEVKDSDTSDNGEADEAGAMSVLEDRGDDASFDEVHSWIDDLTDTEQAELVALFWLEAKGLTSQSGATAPLVAAGKSG